MPQTLPSCSPHCTSRPLSLQQCFKATFGKHKQPCYVGGIRVRSSNNDSGSKGASGISEDVLQRLRLAEEEAVILREELAKAKAEALERVGVVIALSTHPGSVCYSLEILQPFSPMCTLDLNSDSTVLSCTTGRSDRCGESR